MKNKEKQVEDIETIIKSNLAEGSFASAFAKKVAIQIAEYYQSKLSENSMVLLSREEYEKLLRKYFVIKVLPYGDYYTGINKKQREIFDCSNKKFAKRFVSVKETKSVTDILDEIGYEYSIEEVDEDLQLSKEIVEKFAKDLLSVWDDLEKWSEEMYEPHSGITPAHIKECIKQFRADEIKEG